MAIVHAGQQRVAFGDELLRRMNLAKDAVVEANRDPGACAEARLDHEALVEARGLAIANVGFDDGQVKPLLGPLEILHAAAVHVLDTAGFEIAEVRAVVDDAHQVGLAETNANHVAGNGVGRGRGIHGREGTRPPKPCVEALAPGTKAADRAPMSSAPPPAPPVPQTYKVVVGVDYSEQSERALRAALDIALHRDVQIYCAAVAEGYGPGRPQVESAEMHQTFRDEAQKNLDRFITKELDLLEAGGRKLNRKRVFAAVDFGKPADGIIALSEDVQADLIVVGTHGRKGLERLFMGSVALEILRRAHCPVLITR